MIQEMNTEQQTSLGSAPMDKTSRAASDIVFYGVLSGLEKQTFVPGQRLIEADLATTFSVGRNSIREALQRLVAEGVIELLKHKGAVIRVLSFKETMAVLDVAELMSGLLLRAASMNREAQKPRDVLEQSLQEMVYADTVRDDLSFNRSRRQFYRALLDLADNRELRRLFPMIGMPLVYAQYRLPSLQQIRIQDYKLFLDVVLRNRVDVAENIGRQHVQNVRACICENYSRR